MDDERLAKIEQERQNAINQSNNTYNTLLQDNQNLLNQQNNYASEYEKTQNDTLDKQLAFNQQKIEQQKEIAKQNMETESKKAKNDYTSYINPYGVQAESFASQGLLNSGVSETAKLGSFNTYQNRLATANKVMQDAFVQYDNDINQARLENDAQKAKNALAKLEIQMNASKDFYNNKSTLTQNQLSYNQNLDDNYFNRYQTEYNNIQTEKEREEAIRQYEQQFAYQKEQDALNLAYQKEQDALRLAEQQRQYNENLAWQREQAAREQANWEREYALSKAASNKGSSGSHNSKGNAGSNGGIPMDDTSKNSGYTPTGYVINNGGTETDLLVKNGKYYYQNGNKYEDISEKIAIVTDKFLQLADGTVIPK